MKKLRIKIIRVIRGENVGQMRMRIRKAINQDAMNGISTNWYFQGRLQ